MTYSSGTLEYNGLEFEYEGEFVPGSPAVLRQDWGQSEPGYGDYFEDFRVTHLGVNMNEMLSEETMEALEKMAVEHEKQ